MSTQVYVNRIATAVPNHEVHRFFLDFATTLLAEKPRQQAIFRRMSDMAGIERRYSCFAPAIDPEGLSIDRDGAWARGAFPDVSRRMQLFETAAPDLACRAVDKLALGEDRAGITHLIVTSCTGFSAPGVDLEILHRCGLPTSVERTMVGFMGCYAAINALKLARHIVRSQPLARVLVVNVEICTLHVRESDELEKLASLCLWGDGCAASLVTAEPHGLRLDGFHAIVDRNGRDLMTWNIRSDGFDMMLSGQVPGAIQAALRGGHAEVLGGAAIEDIDLWAVHPGGRSVLDAVERGLGLPPAVLDASRDVLRCNGNMSSATVMFVLEQMLDQPAGLTGCGMAFGPGLTAETMMFETA